MEVLLGWVLLVGLVSSVTLIAAGIVWHRIATGRLDLDYVLPATSVAGFILNDIRQAAAMTTGPRRLINLGIAVLMITPYVRVVASVAYFALVARDKRYALFSGIVLVTLTYALFK
jgi:uncharacterized membrane protein